MGGMSVHSILFYFLDSCSLEAQEMLLKLSHAVAAYKGFCAWTSLQALFSAPLAMGFLFSLS